MLSELGFPVSGLLGDGKPGNGHPSVEGTSLRVPPPAVEFYVR